MDPAFGFLPLLNKDLFTEDSLLLSQASNPAPLKDLLLTHWWRSRIGAAASQIPGIKGCAEGSSYGHIVKCSGTSYEIIGNLNWVIIEVFVLSEFSKQHKSERAFCFFRASSSICPCMNPSYLLEGIQMRCHWKYPPDCRMGCKSETEVEELLTSSPDKESFYCFSILSSLNFIILLINLCLWPAVYFLFE